MAEGSDVGPKLAEVYDEVWNTYEYLESCQHPTGSDEVQKRVSNAINLAETGVRMVNTLALYSDNEELEDVGTSELRYMMLPGLLAYLTLKNTMDDRVQVINRAQAYIIDFLKLVKLYGLTNVKVPKVTEVSPGDAPPSNAPPKPCAPDLDAMNRQRTAKIERFRKQKEDESRLNELQKQVHIGSAEDEIQREYYTILIKTWINKNLDEFDSIEMEIPILSHLSKMKGKPTNPTQQKPSVNKFRPFILTRSDLQAQVYGAGYPSLPTYTVDQFYEMRYKDQCEGPEGGATVKGHNLNELVDNPDAEQEQLDAEEKEKEDKEENDDEETLRKAREWDEWKDDHRRGWGNRENRS